MTNATSALFGLLGPTGDGLASIFAQMEWAEAEIAEAQARHPHKAEALWDTFLLFRATHERMSAEWVYRPHCRELLERVAAGEDTRPATDVELALGLSDQSMKAPLGTTGTTLYMRVFQRTWPDKWGTIGEDTAAYESVGGQQADMLERQLRRAARCEWRKVERAASERIAA
jgi:hypothetical protein